MKITCQKNPMNPMTIPLIIPHYRYDKFQVTVPRCSTSFTTCSRSLAPPPPLPRCAGTAWWWPGAMWPWAGMWRTRRRGSKAHGERPWEMLVLIGFIWYIWFYMVLYGFIWFLDMLGMWFLGIWGMLSLVKKSLELNFVRGWWNKIYQSDTVIYFRL